MPIRLLIVALLWLTYVLSLCHSLLPHHHHHDDHHGGHSAHHHTAATQHDHQEGDHDSDSDDFDAGWWFGHQHTPDVEYSQVNMPDTYQALSQFGLTQFYKTNCSVICFD